MQDETPVTPQTEAAAESPASPVVEAAAAPKPKAARKSRAAAQAKAAPEPDAAPQAEAPPSADTAPEPKPVLKPKATPKFKAPGRQKPAPAPAASSEAPSAPEPIAAAEPTEAPKPKAARKARAASKAKAVAKPEAAPEAGPEPAVAPEPEAAPEPAAAPGPEVAPEPEPAMDAATAPTVNGASEASPVADASPAPEASATSEASATPEAGGTREITLEELPERLRTAAEAAGWKSLMPVQAQAIPGLLAGNDMIVQARTGSGKTGAFLLPMLERLDTRLEKCQALVLVPTRELARQVEQDAQTLCSGAGFRSVVVYGGVGYREQLDALKQGAQIVIGTPGRVLDLLIKRALSLQDLRVLVFDEADRMLSMGFYPDMKRMQRYLPDRDFQSCMFSATFPSYVLRTAREFIPEPEFLTLTSGKVHVTDIDHRFYEVEGLDKDRGLVRLIEIENPASAIIFCNTKARVHYITIVLQRFGYDADEISADLSQKDRERVLERVRKGTLRFLVATDVAARGLDVPELSHVFQYEPPEDPEAYIHRSGRTGRAGASGIAISLVNIIEKSALQRIASRFGVEIKEHKMPTDADVAEVVAERLTAVLEARLRERDKLQTERSARFEPLARSLAENEDESALITMLLDEYYQKLLHAPVVPPPPPEPQGERPPGSGQGRRRKRR